MALERTYKALLVGISTYTADAVNLDELYGPRNDVAGLQAALSHKEWGLHNPANVIAMVDAEKKDIELAIEQFFRDARQDDQLLFYFSGHGLQVDGERLYLAASDTVSEYPVSTGVAMSFVNEMAGRTRAIASAILLDCCYSGIMKGVATEYPFDTRSRWILTSSRRDQESPDAATRDSLSPFSRHLAAALSGSATDDDGDGYITMCNVKDHVTPQVLAETGRQPTFRWEGPGDLAVALAPGYPGGVDTERDQWLSTPAGKIIPAPPVPVATTESQSTAEVNAPASTVEPEGVSSLVILDESPEALAEKLADLLDGGSDIRMKRLMTEATRRAIRSVETDDQMASLSLALDRLAAFGSVGIDLESPLWLDRCAGALERVYRQGFDSRGLVKVASPAIGGAQPQLLWLSILDRVLALGALAVRNEQWSAVPTLTLRRPDGYDFRHYTNWIRHALTMAARANLLQREVDGRLEDVSVLERAKGVAERLPFLSPDVDTYGEQLLDSLCQFDFLAAVCALAAADSLDVGVYYPSFARFYSHRTEPIVRALIGNQELRSAMPEMPDKALANIVLALEAAADRENWRWGGFSDPAIGEWVEAAQSA